MTREEQQRIEDRMSERMEGLLVKAIQSTKRENSGLVAEIMHKVETTLRPIVDELINGKINKLLEMQRAQNIILESIQAEQERLKAEVASIKSNSDTLDKNTAQLVSDYNEKKTVNNYFTTRSIGVTNFIKNTWAILAAIMGISAFMYWITHLNQ